MAQSVKKANIKMQAMTFGVRTGSSLYTKKHTKGRIRNSIKPF